jgi:hypothetical protein
LALFPTQVCSQRSPRTSARLVAGGCATKLPPPLFRQEEYQERKRSSAERLILQFWKRHSQGSHQRLSHFCRFERVSHISFSTPLVPGSAQLGQSGDYS